MKPAQLLQQTFDKYIQQRNSVVNSLNTDCLNTIKSDVSDIKEIAPNPDSINTESALSFLLSTLNENKDAKVTESVILDLERWLRKFEITKKLAKEYSSDLKPLNKSVSFHAMCCLSLSLLLYFEKNGNPKYINTALKINDQLSACQSIELKTKTLLLEALTKEIECVKRLYNHS